MKRIFKLALRDTLPVLAGYIVLGFGFGLIMKSGGFSFLLTFFMSAFIYAGSMQYAAVGLLTGPVSLITVAVTTLMVNARHIFYGISMLESYKKAGKRKPYLIFALTDETYSLVSNIKDEKIKGNEKDYYLSVSLLNHSYWVLGSLLGYIFGTLVTFSSEGVEFALTALFLVIFTEQLLSDKKYLPSIIGVGVTALCLIIFSADNFLLIAMPVILLLLLILRGEGEEHGQ